LYRNLQPPETQNLGTLVVCRLPFHIENTGKIKLIDMKRICSLSFFASLAMLNCVFLALLPVSASWAPIGRQPAFRKSTGRTTASRSIHSPQPLHMAFVDGWFSFQNSVLHHIETDSESIPKIFILIPAYNEEDRIQSTLETYRDFLLQSNLTSEILVVDDGSTDGTVDVVNSFLVCSSEEEKVPVQCLSIPTNQGKGAALAAGIKHIAEKCCVKGKNATLILTQDADGSGNLMYLECMIDRMKDLLTHDEESDDDAEMEPLASIVDWTKPAIVTGNRNYNFFTPRGITRWGFQTAVRLIMNDLRVQDSQCGYKLMTLAAAGDLFDELEVTGWAHDVEVLYRAKLVDIPIEEISIDWDDKDGSKVVQSGVARVSAQMLLDVIKVRWEYSSLRAFLNLGDF
jgi:dolichyl-phosphate beta-glucosyltransferase